VRLRLTPQETSFFDVFASLANTIVEGANLLAELLGQDRKGRERIAEKLREVEHAADEFTHEIMRKLNSSFITPFDRQDIYALASGLDDCMDLMDSAADLIVLYRLDELPTGISTQVSVLQRQAELTADAMPRLRSMKDLAEYWVEINRLENEGDRFYRRTIAELFSGDYKAMDVLKFKEIIEQIEGAIDRLEDVANAIESIYLKQS
jgi:predicted phosphate transport protein (TIGR00153 family)